MSLILQLLLAFLLMSVPTLQKLFGQRFFQRQKANGKRLFNWDVVFASITKNYFATSCKCFHSALSNTFISLVKDTSLASLVLVTEMFRRAQEIAAANFEFLLVYSEAALIYWVICFFLSILQQSMEKRLDRYASLKREGSFTMISIKGLYKQFGRVGSIKRNRFGG